MNKVYLLAIFVLHVGCKQIYDPITESNNGSLVINGILTNNTEMSRVTISRSASYSPNNKQQFVSGADVKIYDNTGIIYNLSETSTGVYTNPKLKAEDGKTYFLEVISPEGDVYRSEAQFLPEKTTVDTITGEVLKKKITATKLNGEYFQTEKTVFEPYFDLSNNSQQTPKCRFDIATTIVYLQLKAKQSIVLWKTLKFSFDITSSRYELNSNQIKKQPLIYLYTDINEYATAESPQDKDPFARVCYILFIDKYDLNLSTHQYYKEIKQQSEFAGKIFDPVPIQIKGNITCVNNPEKTALGMFEVSNFEKFIYICRFHTDTEVTITKKDTLINFTESGKSESTPEFLW